jgi:hypothetical protein
MEADDLRARSRSRRPRTCRSSSASRRLEHAESGSQQAETEREQAAREARTTRAERWVMTAAKDFQDPDDATRFVNLDDIESVEDAERAVKRVAKSKPHLLKSDDANVPGKVLSGGRPVAQGQQAQRGAPAGSAFGVISTEDEAQAVADALAKFRRTGGKTSITFGA